MKNISTYLKESVKSPARVFVIIKPGFLDLSQKILERFEQDGWKPYRMITKKLLESEAKKLYAIHKKEDWYNDLVKYMSSDISTGCIMENPNKEMSSKVFKDVETIKDEIREQYGESEMRNVMHSSDSLEHMATEQSVYF